MQYVGGKRRQSKFLIPLIESNDNGQTYVEPFCGSLAVGGNLKWSGNLILSDKHEYLMRSWRYFYEHRPQYNYDFTVEQYDTMHKNKFNSNDWRIGLYKFGLSFAGVYTGTLACHKRGVKVISHRDVELIHEYANKVCNNLDNLNFKFSCCDYHELDIPDESFVYADPPYVAGNRRNQYGLGKFDHKEFWGWARNIAKRCQLIVTEFEAPEDFKPIFSFGNTSVQQRGNNGIEKGVSSTIDQSKQEHIWIYKYGLPVKSLW